MVILNELMARIAGRFGRIEPRRAAGAYVRKLLARHRPQELLEPGRTCRADRAAGAAAAVAHHPLDADAVRDDVRDFVVERLGPDGVLIVDETGFVKKGVGSAGVQRQYSGAAGRIENCQIGVFLAYATTRGRALLDRRLYLPEHTWLADPGRCHAAGVPDETHFATKPALAIQMLLAAIEAGVPASWVSGDEVYGQDPRPRVALEEPRMGYVLRTDRRKRGPRISVAADQAQPDHRRAGVLPLLRTHPAAVDGPGQGRRNPMGG
ncbi:transposase [Nonomuraea sp. NPDC049695]|uniref:IS701 family transposase n=1 Tax=Nonomuraea sp. NPDC049695 TaxID=3154734 RepID=UPI003440A875